MSRTKLVQAEFDQAEKLDWLQLSRSEGVGPITFFRLLARFGSAADALEALPDLGTKSIRLADRQAIEDEAEKTESYGARLIAFSEPGYPPQLKAIADPPPLIAVCGPLDLSLPAIAIVGARNASAAGRKMASDLARDIGEGGYTIVSGLARGVDGAAHLASVRTGTIAVIAGGIDSIYPPEHAGLYRTIAQHGAVISEIRFGHTARAQDFPKRNRIVSGLARGVIVVEAAERSGTLITARLAAEQGRDVFAVPGSPLDPRSAGTNRLIRQGARLIRHADDVFEELSTFQGISESTGPEFDSQDSETATNHEDLKDSILQLLSPFPTHRDELVRQSGLTPSQVSDILLDLVLDGIVQESSGGRFELSSDNLSSTY